MQHKIIIGLEVHCSISNTKSKLLCSCPNKIVEEPNSICCPTCLGLPGAKPVMNKEALNQAIRLALALNCKINQKTFFSRKTYFYLDMVRNWQTTQYEVPLGENGCLNLNSGKKIRIRRVHLEEDPGALIHKGSICLIDYNRSGIPLCEIVTEPDLNSPQEAKEFLKKIRNILKYLDIYNPKISVIKADLNINLDNHERTEIKNVTGFKEIEKAINYEVERQKELIGEKNPIKERVTLGWDSNNGKTFFQRGKESETDYGYIMESDLPTFEISPNLINELRKQIPELSTDKISRFKKDFNLLDEDAETLSAEKELAELFELVAEKVDPQLAARWLRRDLIKVLHYNKKSLKDVRLDAKHVIELLTLLQENKINDATAKDLLIKLIEKPFSPKNYVEKQNLSMLSSESELEEMCQEVIKNNKEVVGSYKQGKKESIHYLVGQVMRLSKGKANPKEVQKILKKLI